METKEVKTAGVNNKVSAATTAKAPANGIQERVGTLSEKKDADAPKPTMDIKKEESNNLPAKPAETVSSKEPVKNDPLKAEPQSERKEEKQEIKFEKPALNLESTLKLVEELHRRKIQRDKLLETINTLEAFEVAQQEDSDETGSHFQGCILTVEDDERRKFSTKNPVIIQAVAQYVNSLCVNRLAEIEAGITIPA